MPTREQLESALFNADKAGDFQAAKSIANELKSFNIDLPQHDYLRPQETPVSDAGLALVSGANTLLPNIAGLPMDFARNAANLGLAGYGVARKELGEIMGEDGYIPPEPIKPLIGGSEWMRRKIALSTQALGGDPFAMPNPSDPLQQKAHMAGSILASGALAPSKGIKEAALNVARMTVPATGAVGMQEAFPEQPLAPIIGMMAAPAGVAATVKTKNAISPTVSAAKSFLKAHKLGYKVPPALAKPSKTQQVVEGSAGVVPTKQKASLFNQKVTNDLIKKDLGYPKDVPLSREGLGAIRSEAGRVYEKAKTVGTFKTDKTFIGDISKISNQGSALAKEFPNMVKQDVAKLAKTFNKKQISSEALVEAVKQLRADSSAGFRSQDPSTLALAKANGKMASALESLMERSISKTHPELSPSLKAARQKIAKTYTVEKALKGDNVDAVALGRDLDKGKPLSGVIRDVAEFGQSFKGAAQVNVPQQTNFRPMDLLTGVSGAAVTGNMMWLTAALARPALRTLTLSKPYQAVLARQRPEVLTQAVKELKNIATMADKQAQSVAISSMMADLQESGNIDSR